MKNIYSKKEITTDYDKGYSIDGIAERYKKAKEEQGITITSKRAKNEVSEIIYDHIMKHGLI